MDHIKVALKESLGLLESDNKKLKESILLDEGLQDLAKKGFGLLSKTKKVAKSILKSSWRPALLLILATGAAYAGGGDGIDFSPYIEKLNSLFSNTRVEPQTITHLLSVFVDALHSSDIPIDQAQSIVDQVDVFNKLGSKGDMVVDMLYQAKDMMGEDGATGAAGAAGGTSGATSGTSSSTSSTSTSTSTTSSDGGATTTSDVGSTTTDTADTSDSDSDSDSDSKDSKYPVGIGGIFRRTFKKNFKCPSGYNREGGICVPKSKKGSN